MLHKHIVFSGLVVAALSLLPVAALSAETKPHVDASGANMQPAYPETAVASREQGAAVISVLVRSDGTVRRVALHRSSGHSDLDSAAANAVSGWKFVPATDDGKPVERWTDVEIVFTPPD